MSRLYFSYGANLNVDNMKFRCPQAERVGNLKLPDFRLVFRGVADIERHNGGSVEGLIWKITDDCENSLDVFEGYPYLYRKEFFVVKMPNGDVEDVMYYKMNKNGYSMPSTGYFNTIYQGYDANGLEKRCLHNARSHSKTQHGTVRTDGHDWDDILQMEGE